VPSGELLDEVVIAVWAGGVEDGEEAVGGGRGVEDEVCGERGEGLQGAVFEVSQGDEQALGGGVEVISAADKAQVVAVEGDEVVRIEGLRPVGGADGAAGGGDGGDEEAVEVGAILAGFEGERDAGERGAERVVRGIGQGERGGDLLEFRGAERVGEADVS
jgi:hypothetical protein